MTQTNINELFDNTISFPDPEAQERLSKLIGLDDKISNLSKVLGLLINKDGLKKWAEKYYSNVDDIMNIVLHRPSLVVLAGDVGSGKSELAETIGDFVARQEKIDITLFPLSLSSRGQGRVGEMTQLISTAFKHTIKEAEKLKHSDKVSGGIILLIDEADALAQSRESSQMHHEDKAGVNAFIRGIDSITHAKLPVAVIMCTNRINALDPAIRRRAAEVLIFERPDDKKRKDIITSLFSPFKFSDKDIMNLVEATGPTKDREFGFTFSDIVQRLTPAIILDAYPTQKIDPTRALKIAKSFIPTKPFVEDSL